MRETDMIRIYISCVVFTILLPDDDVDFRVCACVVACIREGHAYV